MSSIRSFGAGYYGVEPTGAGVSVAVLEQMDKAYDEAMAIPDDEIVVRDHVYDPQNVTTATPDRE